MKRHVEVNRGRPGVRCSMVFFCHWVWINVKDIEREDSSLASFMSHVEECINERE